MVFKNDEIKWPLMSQALSMTDRLKMAWFVLTLDRFTNGKYVKNFEYLWNEWLGSKHSLFVSSGSSANLLLISSIKELYGLKNGDKVLVPSCTWSTTISPIIQNGLQPIFCDVNLNNFSFDLKHAKKIASKHKDIKIVFTTHLLGFVAPPIKDIFPNAIFIDDVCESHGAKMSNNKKVGSESLGATFSFYFGHHMTTIEGGMISTNNFDLYNLMRMKRSHGMARESKTLEKFSEMYPEIDKHFLFPTDGYNLRSTELNAILGISQLKKLDANIISRKKNYSKFYSILCDYQDFFYLPENNENNSSFCLPIMCKSKDITNKLKQLFKDNFIEYRPVVCGNLLEQPFLKNRGYTLEPNSINNIDIIHYQSIYIGNNQFIADKNFKILKKIFNQL